MKWVTRYFPAILFCISASCIGGAPGQLGPATFVHYVEDESNLLKNTIKSGVWTYCFQYKPPSYIALKEQNPDRIDKSEAVRRISSLKQTVWFNISIGVQGSGIDPLKYQAADLNEYNRRLNYFLQEASHNIHLFYGANGEMKQAGYVFENNYGIKPEVTVIVGFYIPDSMPNESMTVEYDDGLFNAGILKFNLTAYKLQNIPSLDI